jgi:chemotaxis receptor (MCP) glutamine deamidase CheD
MSKAPFLESLLVSSFLDAFTSLIFYCPRKKVRNMAHLILSDTVQYRAMSKTIAYGVHSVTIFVSVIVVVMSGFDLC